MARALALSLALGAALLATVAPTIVQDCGSTSKVNEVKVSGCDIPPCHLVRGEDIVVDIDFESPQASSQTLKASVHGNIGGIDIPWFGVDENACNDLTVGDCPLETSEKFYYSARIPILSSYPSVTVIVKWELVGQSNEIVACFVVPAQIV